MPIQCNIDSKGKAIRLAMGVLVLVTGALLLIVWALPTSTIPAWTCAAACVVTGAFMIFESRAGWCVARAMGFKTPW